MKRLGSPPSKETKECHICGEGKTGTFSCWVKGYSWLAIPPHEDYFSCQKYHRGATNKGYTEPYWFSASVCPECYEKVHRPTVQMPDDRRELEWK